MKTNTAETLAHEKRTSPRVTTNLAVEYRVPGNDVSGRARIADVSDTGVQMVSDDEIPHGTDLVLRIEVSRPPIEAMLLSGKVVRSHADEDERFVIGCHCD